MSDTPCHTIFRCIVEVTERACHRCAAVIAKTVTISGNNRGQIEIRRHLIFLHNTSDICRATGGTDIPQIPTGWRFECPFQLECLCVLLQHSALGAVLLIIDNLQLEIAAAADFQISVVVSSEACFFEQLDCCLIERRCLYAGIFFSGSAAASARPTSRSVQWCLDPSA